MFVFIFRFSTNVCANLERLEYSGHLTPPRTSSASTPRCLARTSAWVLRRTLAAPKNRRACESYRRQCHHDL